MTCLDSFPRRSYNYLIQTCEGLELKSSNPKGIHKLNILGE